MEDVNESIKNKKDFEVEEHISNLNESNQVLNENLESVTANGDCENCAFGCEGECRFQCNKSYIDFIRDLREWLYS